MGLLDDAVPERYEKNPMLVIVENYVLDAIGKLDAAREKKLSEMICKTFGGKDWRATIRQQLDLPAETATQLQTAWKQHQEEAEAKQEDLAPEDFAREVADDMFSGRGS